MGSLHSRLRRLPGDRLGGEFQTEADYRDAFVAS